MTSTEIHSKTNATMPKVHLKHAWLITWMGTEPWTQPNWRSIMAIFSGHRSLKYAREALWLLDVRAKCPGYGMAYFAYRRQKHGLPYKSGPGWRTEGSNAWLYARQVTNLQVTIENRLETIQWVEPDFIKNHPETSELIVCEHGRSNSVTRSVDENLGGEPYHRWI